MRYVIRYILGGMDMYRKAAREAFIISKEAEDNY
jgi:hypothetical protein